MCGVKEWSDSDWPSLLDTLPRGIVFVLLNGSRCVEYEGKTVAVSVEPDGTVTFFYNAVFWQQCSLEERKFCVLHEALHILLEHWGRLDCDEANVAADLVVNHLIVNTYRLIARADIRFARELCWVDTVFRRHKVGINESLEFYMNKLRELPRVNAKKTLDDHQFEVDENGLHRLKERVAATFRRGVEVDDALEEIDYELLQNFVMVPIDWARIVQGIFRKFRPGMAEHWILNKRMDAILGDLTLPCEIRDPSLPAVNATLFIDTSRSCSRYLGGFLKSLRHVPRYVTLDVKGFCGKVYDIHARSPRLYTGSTSFAVIERNLRKRKVYPDCVIVLTDGYGDPVKPLFPKRWHWVLVKPCKTYVPAESRIWPAYVSDGRGEGGA